MARKTLFSFDFLGVICLLTPPLQTLSRDKIIYLLTPPTRSDTGLPKLRNNGMQSVAAYTPFAGG